MKALICLIAFGLSLVSLAGSPVGWNASCSTGIFNFAKSACLSSGGGAPTFTYPKGSLTGADVGKFLMEDSGAAAVYAQEPPVVGSYETWTAEITDFPAAFSTVFQGLPGSAEVVYGADWASSGTLGGVATNLATAWNNLGTPGDCGGGGVSFAAVADGVIVTFTATAQKSCGGATFQTTSANVTILNPIVGAASSPASSLKQFLGVLSSIDGSNAVISNVPVFSALASGAIDAPGPGNSYGVNISVIDGTHIKQYPAGNIHGRALHGAADGAPVLFRISN